MMTDLADLALEQQDDAEEPRRKRVALIGCGKQKAERTCAASEMYRSALFRAAWRWASLHCDQVFILSAKHGLLEPTTIIEPYDEALPRDLAGREAWGMRVGAQIDKAVPDLEAILVVLAGERYADVINFEDRFVDWGGAAARGSASGSASRGSRSRSSSGRTPREPRLPNLQRRRWRLLPRAKRPPQGDVLRAAPSHLAGVRGRRARDARRSPDVPPLRRARRRAGAPFCARRARVPRRRARVLRRCAAPARCRVRQEGLFGGARLQMNESIELTIDSFRAHAGKHDVWAIAWSGGKDSTALLTLTIWLVLSGRVARPRKIVVLYADTRMEIPPLWHAARTIRDELVVAAEELAALGVELDVRVVMAQLDHRFFVYIFGRGVPPPSNTFRWCTEKMKVMPMETQAIAIAREAGGRVLMLTGLRKGESAARDARIAVACSKDDGECGQGLFQLSLSEEHCDKLAPLLHWRTCHAWEWLKGLGAAGRVRRLVDGAHRRRVRREGGGGPRGADRLHGLQPRRGGPRAPHLRRAPGMDTPLAHRGPPQGALSGAPPAQRAGCGSPAGSGARTGRWRPTSSASAR